jgi:recombination protein RecT
MTAPAKPAPLAKPPKYEFDRPAPGGVATLQKMGETILPQIAAALPAFMARHSERMLRCLITECGRTPKLLDCTPRSLFGGVIQVAQLGLELGGPAGQAYLLPFNDRKRDIAEATLCIGYKGYITLAHRAGVKRFTPRIVREGDTFHVEYGSHQVLKHLPKFPADGPVIGYYAVVETGSGGIDFEYLTFAQAEQHKARYALMKSGGPWKDHFDEMALKTAIRRLAKRVPLSVEWVAAAGIDEQADEGIPQQLGAAVVIEGEEPVDALKERLAKAKKGEVEPSKAELDADGNPILFNAGAGLPD